MWGRPRCCVWSYGMEEEEDDATLDAAGLLVGELPLTLLSFL